MAGSDFDREWKCLSEEVVTGMREWRLSHPRAKLSEIEVALDERLNRMRARMLEDAASASAASDWKGEPEAEHPRCPECGKVLVARGRRFRGIQSQGGQQLRLSRTYGECPGCGAGFFPPG